MCPALGVEKAEVAFWSSKKKRSPDRQRLCAGMQSGEEREMKSRRTQGSQVDTQTRLWAVSKGPGKKTKLRASQGGSQWRGQRLRYQFSFGPRPLVTPSFTRCGTVPGPSKHESQLSSSFQGQSALSKPQGK